MENRIKGPKAGPKKTVRTLDTLERIREVVLKDTENITIYHPTLGGEM